MKVLRYPDDLLKTKCEEIKVFDRMVEYWSDEMIKTMLANGGIGLAANQVGLNARMFVMIPILSNVSKGLPMTLINPEIVHQEGNANMPEGCLSAPGRVATLPRANKVRVKFQNLLGMEVEREFEGINAVCVQHEIDHLNGIFFLEKERS